MIRKSFINYIILGIALSVVGAAGLMAQGAKPSGDQKDQLNRLAQLEDQLQKDRAVLHAAIADFGWESEEADEAREQLVNDRTEYRKLRRSLRAAGVEVPPPSGMGAAGRPDDQPSRRYGRWQGRHHGCHLCPYCD